MGKDYIFTKEQQIILDEVKNSTYFTSNFYFTGGTALSSFYLNHRESEDLDFFSEREFDNEQILTLVEEWSRKYLFTFSSRFNEVVYVFQLVFENGEKLKVDFGYYPYKRVEKGFTWNSIEIDSLIDVAINKLLTISQRLEVKDFADLYYLLEEFTVWDLMEGVRVKFGQKLEPFLLAADFLKVEEFDYLPKMIKPLTIEQLKDFFRKKAIEVGRKGVE